MTNLDINYLDPPMKQIPILMVISEYQLQPRTKWGCGGVVEIRPWVRGCTSGRNIGKGATPPLLY